MENLLFSSAFPTFYCSVSLSINLSILPIYLFMVPYIYARRVIHDSNIKANSVKGNAQFIFLCHPQKLSVNVCLMKILKTTVTKESNCLFL